MRRRQITCKLLAVIMAASVSMSAVSLPAFAAENAGGGTTETSVTMEAMEAEDFIAVEAGEDPENAEQTDAEEAEVLEDAQNSDTVEQCEESENDEQYADSDEATDDDQDLEEAVDASDAATEQEAEEEKSEEKVYDEEINEDENEDVNTQSTEENLQADETISEQIDEIDLELMETQDVLIEEVQEEVQRDAMEYGSDDYPYKSKSYGTYRNPDDWDPWLFYYRECTSFCAWRLNKTNGISFTNNYKRKKFGDAHEWISAAKQAGITVNSTPAVGAVACWDRYEHQSGSAGHVAWVCAVSGNSVTIEEYNWGSVRGVYGKRTVKPSSPDYPTCFIHFKDINVCTHWYRGDRVQTVPTATSKGKWQLKCRYCGETKTQDIPALGNAPIANGKYMVLSKLGSEKYISVASGQTYQGGKILLYTKGKAEQTLTLTKNSNGSYLIMYGDYALEAKGDFYGDTIQLNKKNGSAAQEWYIVPAGNGWYRLTTRNTYYNMDVAYSNSADGTEIGTWYNNGNDAQLFKFVAVKECSHWYRGDKVQTAPTATSKGKWQLKCRYCGETKTQDIPALGYTTISNGKYKILSKLGSEKYLSVTPNQNYQGGNIALYSSGKAEQTFTFSKNSNGSYLIKYGNYVLEAKGDFYGDTIQLNKSNGSAAQQWYIVPAGNGWYRLIARSTYYNMDVTYANTADGTEIGTWYNNGNDAQLFKLVPDLTNDADYPSASAMPAEPDGPVIQIDISLPASAKVTATNVASGIKLRWEPVSGAAEYVVYRGSTQIKRTTKTEITDVDVKYDNGSKFIYKVAAVSKDGKVSTNVRSSTYYRILPVGITSVKNTGAGKMTVTYGKNEMGSGYVVRYGLKSDMSDAKVITIKDSNTTIKIFSGLKKGNTYYVQVRSYKIENGVRYYSGYCTTKTVKINK